jgi:hypothetical protein
VNIREKGKFNLNIKIIEKLADNIPDKNLSKSIEGARYFYFQLLNEDSDSDENI